MAEKQAFPPTDGVAEVGDTLVAAPFSVVGPTRVRWKRNGVDIPGAVGRNYTPTVSDLTAEIRASLTFLDGRGNQETRESNPTFPVKNYAVDWPFAEYASQYPGQLPGPWKNLSRTGLGTRVDSAGLVGFGPHNLLLQSRNPAASPWGSFIQGAGVAPVATALNPGARLQFDCGDTSSSFHRSLWRQNVSGLTLGAPVSATLRIRAFDAANVGKTVRIFFENLGSAVIVHTLTAEMQTVVVASGVAALSSSCSLLIECRGANTTQTADCVLDEVQVNYGAPQPHIPTTTAARYLPRLTWASATLSALGLLVEGQGTQLFARTDNLSASPWALQGVTVQGTRVTGPDGALSAQRFTPTIADAALTQDVVPASVVAFTNSVWLRSASGSNFDIALRLIRDSPFATVASQTITVTAEWQRFVFTATPLDATNHRWRIGSGSVWGLGEVLDVWGPQLETGSVATSYIPNPGTGSAVRVADDWFLSGAAFTAAIDPSVGTFFVEFFWAPGPPVGGVFSISDNTNSNRIDYRAGQSYVEIAVGGVVLAGISAGMSPQSGWNRIAVAWSAAGYAISLNGGAPVTGTANCSGLAANQLQLGNINPRTNTTFHLGYPIRTARSFRGQYITGAALQALTA